MKHLLIIIFFIYSLSLFAQIDKGFDSENFKKELADKACMCIDSISTYDQEAKSVSNEIHKCIDKQVMVYQFGKKISGIADIMKDTLDQKKEINININTNTDSKEYKTYYYELERYLMENCSELTRKVASNGLITKSAMSVNREAIKWYEKGIDESERNNYKKAIKHYKKALKIDNRFAFAWDNLGIAYRQLGEYKKAIEAYENSLELDPKGKTPLQNLAVVYLLEKEFNKAIETYVKLSDIDKNNPEVYYGIGVVYFQYKNDLEKGLQNICKAYTLYVEQKSPYRTDAENIINEIYSKMKKNGNEKRFLEILKENNINN